MSKAKTLFGLAFMVGLLVAMTASSASALFSSTNGKDGGQGKAGKTVFTDEGAVVECEQAVGTWKLTKGKIGKETVQVKGAENVDLHVNALNAKPAGWEKCKSTNALGTLEEITECELQVKQQVKGQSKAVGGVIKGCVVTVSGCTVHVEPEAANENLKKIENENKKPEELFSEVSVTGITSTAKGSLCGLGGINNLKNSVGEEKGKVKGVGLQEE
jgi:hypothetical protein